MGLLQSLAAGLGKLGNVNEETGLSGWDTIGGIGARLQDATDGGDRYKPYAETRAATAKRAVNKQQADYLDELAQSIGLSPGERLLMRVSPEKAAEVMAKKLSPLVVGGQVYQEGKFEAPTEYKFDQGRGYSIGPQGLQSLGELAPSYSEETARMGADKPVAVGDGAVLVDPRTGKPIYKNPKTFAPQRPPGGGLSSMTTEQLIALAGSLK